MNFHASLLCQRYLKMLYQDISYTYLPDNIAQTSGEILYESISKLLPFMSLTSEDTFADLGSATGKIISQIFLTTPVKKAIGIEIIPELHNTAVVMARKIKNDFAGFHGIRELIFMNEDFLKISLNDMTVIIVNSTCFPPSLVDQIGIKIQETPSIRAVFSLRPLYTLSRLKLKKVIPVECSWDSVLCYFYCNN